MRKLILSLFLIAVITSNGLIAQPLGAASPLPQGEPLKNITPHSPSSVIMQAFYWDCWPIDPLMSWYDVIAEQAPSMKAAGITHFWFPPPNKDWHGQGGMGYALFDHFDIGQYYQKGTTRTRFGYKYELIHAASVAGNVLLDLVPNHMLGGAAMLDPFDNTYRHQRFEYAHPRFWKTVDHFFPCPIVGHDPFSPLIGEELNHGHPEVWGGILEWAAWLRDTVGHISGFRVDGVKHFCWYMSRYIGKQVHSIVGEYWCSQANIDSWIHHTGGFAFDFPLYWAMSGSASALPGAGLHHGHRSINFVANHDTNSIPHRARAYGFIFYTEPIPKVFWSNWFNPYIQPAIKRAMAAREAHNFTGTNTLHVSGDGHLAIFGNAGGVFGIFNSDGVNWRGEWVPTMKAPGTVLHAIAWGGYQDRRPEPQTVNADGWANLWAAPGGFAYFAAVTDYTPPYTTGHLPLPGATGVPPNTDIIVRIRDAGAGVKQDSIIMSIGGIPVTPVITGTAAEYTLTYNPAVNFAPGQTVNVTIDARDLAANIMDRHSYSFRIEEHTPPYTVGHNPAPGAAGVFLNTNITVYVRDIGVGVDQTTITMTVEGHTVTPVITGAASEYALTYNPAFDFTPGQVVNVIIGAADLDGNTMAPDSYSFTVGEALDTIPPYTTDHSPVRDATGVPRGTNIVVHVRDASAGVNQATIAMTVEGASVTPTITGTPAEYILTYNPAANFNFGQVVNVTVAASDLAGNAMATDAYSFTIKTDTTPPYTFSHNPAGGAVGVPVDTNIVVYIEDAGIGVDLITIAMTVEGASVTPEIIRGFLGYRVTYNPAVDFAPEQVVDVTVGASDLAGNAMATDAYSFTIEDTVLPILEVTPYLLYFGAAETRMFFNITNTGTGALKWKIGENEELWLSVEPAHGEVAVNETDTVMVSVNRRELTPGPHPATILIESDGGAGSVKITMEVKPIPPPLLDFSPGDKGEDDVGEVYLINPVTGIPPTLRITNFGELGEIEITKARWIIWEIEGGERDKEMDTLWTTHLEQLTLPHGMLEAIELNELVSYEAQVEVMNKATVTATSYPLLAFRTVAYVDTDDPDKDGIPDEQEVDEFVDLDEDEVDDRDPKDIDIAALRNVVTGLKTAVQVVGQEFLADTPRVARAKTLDAYGLAPPLDYRFPEGVFNFRIEGLAPGSWVHVKFHLSELFQEGDVWWKYDTIHDWRPYATAGGEGAERIIAGVGTNRVTLKFVDGGYGDADGVADGVIVDPGGLGRLIPAVDPVPAVADANGCFIATVVFGTSMAEEVEVLSRLRDEYLLTNELGQRLVALYERHSPQWAEFISEREGAKVLVRLALRPLVKMAELVVD